MTLEPTASEGRGQTLEIEWLDQTGPLPVVFFRQKARRVRISGAGARLAPRGVRGTRAGDWRQRSAAGAGMWRTARGAGRRESAGGFTLLELLAVLAIIGILASMMLPHLKGFNRSNSMNAATRQLLDDISYARQRAMANRSIVYMVFVPPSPWMYLNALTANSIPNRTYTNLFNDQYRGYALVSLRSVGDQPGRPRPSYLTDWKTLPNGVLIPTSMYNTNWLQSNPAAYTTRLYTSNTLAGPNVYHEFDIRPFNDCSVPLPFPTLQTTFTNLPYIAFGPNGNLVDDSGNQLPGDRYIPLTSGGILYPADPNGNPLETPPLINENPPGEWTNNAVLIHIDSTTGRAKIERNQF